MLKIRRANIGDTNEVIIHYKTVINQIQNYKNNPGWEFGIYPTNKHIEDSIKQGELYIGKLDSKVIAAMVMDNNPLEANDKIKWTLDLDEDEICYIHLVSINQNHKNKGLAKQMLNYAFEVAKNNSKQSIRLSLNVNNLAIENLYIKTGFKNMGTEEVFIENRGKITFKLYEKII